ncbi:MAG: hypothetical protein LBS55_12705 [Prevotellaceae bacterium]|jgi:hypothetical protein|nr:hypothetical protein [Prevotellaceae bacterium]
MIYNQTNSINGIPMPLLMAYMTAKAIQDADPATPVMYDPVSQIASYDARVVGTRSLKTRQTGGKTDKANEIDDQKNV